MNKTLQPNRLFSTLTALITGRPRSQFVPMILLASLTMPAGVLAQFSAAPGSPFAVGFCYREYR